MAGRGGRHKIKEIIGQTTSPCLPAVVCEGGAESRKGTGIKGEEFLIIVETGRYVDRIVERLSESLLTGYSDERC